MSAREQELLAELELARRQLADYQNASGWSPAAAGHLAGCQECSPEADDYQYFCRDYDLIEHGKWTRGPKHVRPFRTEEEYVRAEQTAEFFRTARDRIQNPTAKYVEYVVAGEPNYDPQPYLTVATSGRLPWSWFSR